MDIWASRKIASSWKSASLQWWPHAALVHMKTPHLGTRWICRAHLSSIMIIFHPIWSASGQSQQIISYLACLMWRLIDEHYGSKSVTFRSSNINEGSVTSSCVFTNIWIDCLAAVRDRLWPGRHFVLVGIGPRTNTTYMRHSALHHTLWLVGDLSNCVQRHFGVCAHCYHKMNWDQPD